MRFILGVQLEVAVQEAEIGPVQLERYLLYLLRIHHLGFFILNLSQYEPRSLKEANRFLHPLLSSKLLPTLGLIQQAVSQCFALPVRFNFPAPGSRLFEPIASHRHLPNL